LACRCWRHHQRWPAPKGSGGTCGNAVVTLAGTVSSGAGPSAVGIAGADVTIYQARRGAPKVLATATADQDGAFSVALHGKDDDGIRYAVARKGRSVELAAVNGSGTPPAITINGMTTVATAYAMAQFLNKGEIAGKPQPQQVAARLRATPGLAGAGPHQPARARPPWRRRRPGSATTSVRSSPWRPKIDA
jgi:hypothetical protein